MKCTRWWFLGSILVALVGSVATVHAAGFSIFEQGDRAMARSGAFTATASDPSAIFFNPAGLAFQTQAWQVYVGGTAILPNVSFEGMNPFPGDGVTENVKSRIFFPPTLYITKGVHERVVVGIGLFSAFGLATTWENPETFTGRHISYDSGITTFSIQPTIAVRVSDRFAIGAGVEIRAVDVRFNRFVEFFEPFTTRFIDIARAELDSDLGWGVGFAAGLLYRLTDQVRIGFSYRHHMDIDLEGTSRLTFIPTGNPQLDALLRAQIPAEPVPAQAPAFAFPKFLSFGVAISPWETWDFEIDINWAQWSRFERIRLIVGDTETVLPENYDDVFSVRFGVEKRLNDRWTLLGGFLFDQNPVPVESVDPVLPDADRWGVNLGFQFRSGPWTVDVAGLLLFFENRTVTPDDCSTPEAFQACRHYYGTYKNFTTLVGVSIGYTF